MECVFLLAQPGQITYRPSIPVLERQHIVVWPYAVVRAENLLGQQDLQGTPDGLPRYTHFHSPLWRGNAYEIQPLHGTQYLAEQAKV